MEQCDWCGQFGHSDLDHSEIQPSGPVVYDGYGN